MPPTPNATTLGSGLWVVSGGHWGLGCGSGYFVGRKLAPSFWIQGLKLFWIHATLLLHIMIFGIRDWNYCGFRQLCYCMSWCWLQVGSKWAPIWPQVGSKLGPSWLQVGTKLAPRWLQVVPTLPKLARSHFLLLFTALRGCQGHHAAAVRSQHQLLLLFTALCGGQGHLVAAWRAQSPFLLLFTRL